MSGLAFLLFQQTFPGLLKALWILIWRQCTDSVLFRINAKFKISHPYSGIVSINPYVRHYLFFAIINFVTIGESVNSSSTIGK